jgi:ABC-2 type transport system ATP-binding protein
MIHVEGLTRRFGDLVAVNDVSFDAAPGKVTGLLGPNGAGKTTTLSMISGLLRPHAGKIEIEGVSVVDRPKEAKAKLGVVPQEIALYEELSARENLEFWGSLRGLKGGELKGRIEEVLHLVDLTSRKDAVSKFSGGMKRRLNLAAGILHRPSVLLLDEPTVGIDVQARAHILDVIRAMAEGGTTVLYTTHYLEEAEDLCDRVAIIDKGRILADDRVDDLRRHLGDGSVVSVRGAFDELTFRTAFPWDGEVRFPEEGSAFLTTGREGAARVLEDLLATDLPIEDVTVREPSLQSVFLQLTGRELRD